MSKDPNLEDKPREILKEILSEDKGLLLTTSTTSTTSTTKTKPSEKKEKNV